MKFAVSLMFAAIIVGAMGLGLQHTVVSTHQLEQSHE